MENFRLRCLSSIWKQNWKACDVEELKLDYPVVAPDGELEETNYYLI